MKNPTAQYDDAFRSKIMPGIDMRITHEQVDRDVAEQTVSTLSNFESFSSAEELYLSEVPLGRYSSCEPNRHRMDGSYRLIDENGNNPGLCAVGGELNADGVFSNYPKITYELIEEVSTPFYIVFDIENNEYATDFDIVGYSSGSVIDTLTITDNTLTELVTDSGILNYDKVELIIKKWSKPNRRARVAKFQLGVIKKFTNDILGEVKIFEQYSPTSLTVSTNNISFMFSDLVTQYNPINPNGWATYLQKNQKIIAEIGINGEYVLVGTYFLTDWNIGEHTVKLDGSCAISLTDVMVIYPGGVKTIYQHAVDIFALLGIEDYVLDSSLQNITVDVAAVEKTGRELLRALAIAGMCAFYSDREGYLRIEPPKSTQYEYVLDFEIAAKPDAELQEVVKEIKFGNYVYTMNDTGSTLDIDSTFIRDNTHAQAIAVWLEAFLNKRLALSYTARPNPKLECGDIFEAETHFDDANVNVQLLSSSMTFSQGGLLAVKKVKVA